MKTYLDCLPCMMNQALRAGRLAINDEKLIKKLLDEIGDSIKNIALHDTPVQSGAIVYHRVKEITGIEDPYKEIKADSIKEALELYPILERYIEESDDPVLTAIRIAIAGNVVDFGMDKKFNLKEDLAKILFQDFGIFDYDEFKTQLSKASCILYIGDNAGESVFDKILIQQLGVPVIYAVRGIPIINDVTISDANDSGINDVAKIVSSGTTAPGTILELCNASFRELFDSAPMIISKGQGNFEGLSDANRQIFFLLKAKCHVIANHLGVNENDIVLKAL